MKKITTTILIICTAAVIRAQQADTTINEADQALNSTIEQLTKDIQLLLEQLEANGLDALDDSLGLLPGKALKSETLVKSGKNGVSVEIETDDSAASSGLKEEADALEKEMELLREEIELQKDAMEKAESSEMEAMEEKLEVLNDKLEEYEDRHEELDERMEDVNEALSEISKEVIITEDDDADTTRIRIGKKKLIIIDDGSEESDACGDHHSNWWNEEDDIRHWAGLELGVSGYLDAFGRPRAPKGYDFLELDYSRSFLFNFNFIEKSLHLSGEHAKLITGLGAGWESFAFRKNVTLQPGAASISAITDTVVHLQRNKLKNAFITMPLMLAFNTGDDEDSGFHIVLAVVGAYRIGTKVKQKYTIGAQEYKPKVRDGFNQLPYRLSARAGIGYGNFNIFATYALTPMFEDGQGPVVYPFTAGIRILAL